jgi:hypothetical protein
MATPCDVARSAFGWPGSTRLNRVAVAAPAGNAPGDPYASTESLRRIVGGGSLQCRQTDIDVYGRTIARCSAGDVDLSCAQLEADLAIRRYGLIWC